MVCQDKRSSCGSLLLSGFGCHGLFPGNAESAGFVEDVVRIATSSKEVEAVIDAAVKVGVVRADTSKAKKLRIWYDFLACVAGSPG